MEEWKEYKLEAIGNIVGGATPSTKEPQNYDGDISWITPKDLSNFSGRFISRGERMITSKGFNSCSCKMLPKGSVLFSSRAPIGYVAIASNDLCTNQGFKSIIPDNRFVDSTFLYYLLVYNKTMIEGLGSGTTFKEVSGNVMKNVTVKIPSLDSQRRISSILSSLDDKIEVNRRINDNFYIAFFEVMLIWLVTSLENDNLEQQAIAIFDMMFPAVVSGEDVIGSVITPKRGKGLLSKDAVKGNIPVVAGGLEPATYHNESNTVAPVVTISASGANAGFVNLWQIPVWSSDSSFIDASMTKNVYFWYVMLKKRQKEIFDAQTGSAQPHIYPKHIAEMPLGIFEQTDVEKFTEIVTPMFEIRGRNLKESERLASIRDTLLPKLMSGELKLNEINV